MERLSKISGWGAAEIAAFPILWMRCASASRNGNFPYCAMPLHGEKEGLARPHIALAKCSGMLPRDSLLFRLHDTSSAPPFAESKLSLARASPLPRCGNPPWPLGGCGASRVKVWGRRCAPAGRTDSAVFSNDARKTRTAGVAAPPGSPCARRP